MIEHEFTKKINEILLKYFGKNFDKVFSQSEILQYINIKTKSAHRGSKARGSFANLYAIFVLVEDYLSHGFDKTKDYSKYEGAKFANLFLRQRELPFGSKLQNQGLNHRMNGEFHKYFPTSPHIPIMRDMQTNRYWINEKLLRISSGKMEYNIARAVNEIILAYADAKRDAFQKFIKFCEDAQKLTSKEIVDFIESLIQPNVDARIFEIVSYSILKYYYADQKIYWGFEKVSLKEEKLKLYKTGRTNANDGGIDFVMKPLGRFFQVTETIDVKKYFLDIDKIERYPMTFIVKSSKTAATIRKEILNQAREQYPVDAIVKKYMGCIEEIINTGMLLIKFEEITKKGRLKNILDEIVIQSKVEFNYQDIEDEEETEDPLIDI